MAEAKRRKNTFFAWISIKQSRATGDDVPGATTLGVPAAPGSSWELDLLSVVESAP
jgi:hypothetical protein